MLMRNRQELQEAFKSSGETDFYTWVATQPEGDRGQGRIVSSAPSLSRRAKNLGTAMTQVAKSNKPIFELSEEAKRRLDICKENKCGLAKVTKLPFVGEVLFCQHIDCGCFMGLKTKLSAMKCPKDLW